jgi:membrane protease YdiL (CAAX protease family)
MNAYSLKKEKQRLPLRYLIVIPITAFLLLILPWHPQLTDLHLWYLWPLWILAAHLSCALSNLISERSLRSSWHLLRYSFLCYWKRTSLVHLQSAFLTAVFEETIFRYLLLTVLLRLIGHPVAAIVLTSVLFTVTHVVFNRSVRRLIPILDLFLFSIAVSWINVGTVSFYPALIIHGMRNYILRTLLIRKNV